MKQRFYKSAVKALELFRIYQHKKTPNGIVRNVLLRKVFKYCFQSCPMVAPIISDLNTACLPGQRAEQSNQIHVRQRILNLRSLTGINDLIGQNFRSFVNDISSRRLNLLLQILDLLFKQVAFGISKYAVNDRTDLGTLFTRSFVFLTVVISGLVHIEALLFLVPVDLAALRDKVEDFLADSHHATY